MPDMKIIGQMVHDIGAETTLRLMGIFHNDVQTRLAAVADFIQNGGDVAELRVNAHSLKGLCRTYGAAQGGDAAMELQEACDTGDEALIEEKALAVLAIIPGEIVAVMDAAKSLQG